MRSLFGLILLAMVVAACQPTTAPSDNGKSPRLTPVDVPVGSLVDCSQTLGAGGIVKVNSNPATTSPGQAPFWVTGQITRDDPRTPGVQFYCTDTKNQIDWNVFFTYPYCLTALDVGPAYAWQLQLTCGASGSQWKAIAIPKSPNGTIISSLRDTTIVIAP